MRSRLWPALPVVAALLASGCHRQQQAVLRVGIAALEDEADRAARYEPLRRYLERTLRVRAEIRNAADYAGIIEALKSGNVDLAYFGAASYARAWMISGGNITPLAATLNEEGEAGYYSVIEVRADSPYQALRDLKGKAIAFADPNSTSGYAAPVHFLRKQGMDAASFFGKVVFAGTHEASILSLIAGNCDAAATWAYGLKRTNSTRMADKGVVPRGSTRVLWRSPLLPSSPWTVRRDTPEPLRRAWQRAIVRFPQDDPAGFAQVAQGRETGYVPVQHDFYEPVIEMVAANLNLRKAAP